MLLFIIIVICKKVGVFDAGSTGTRLTVYEIKKNAVVDLKNYKKDKSKGLHEMNTEEVQSEISELINSAEDDVNTIKLGFYGTAGMRSITKKRADQIIKTVRKSLLGKDLIEADVLTGEQEAYYVLNAFSFVNPKKERFTLIDMGGSSCQIVNKNGHQIQLASLNLGMSNRKCPIEKEKPVKHDNLNVDKESRDEHKNKEDNRKQGKKNSEKRIQADRSKESKNPDPEIALKAEGVDASTLNKNKQKSKTTPIKLAAEKEGNGINKKNLSNLVEQESYHNILRKNTSFRDSTIEIKTSSCANINGSLQCTNSVKSYLSSCKDCFLYNQNLTLPNILKYTLLTSNEVKQKECIQDFFSSIKIKKIKQTGPVYLISAFEYILPKSSNFSLQELYDLNTKKCTNTFDKTCSELYFTMLFLETIGIHKKLALDVPNINAKIPISWTLGKAIELNSNN